MARRLLRGFTRPPRPGARRRNERALLQALRSACDKEPAFRRLMSAVGVRPDAVRTGEDFREKVPVTDKEHIFGPEGYGAFISQRNRQRLASLYTSSGFTQLFSFGAVTRREVKRTAFFIEEILFRIYGISSRDILVVNCLSLGTDIPLRTCTQARTGLRDDSVVEVLRRAGPVFGAVALVGEPHFLKRVAERGAAAGLDWNGMNVFVFTGSEYISESWRAYMRALLGQDPHTPERGAIVSTLGVTELGLALLFETHDLITLRARISSAGAQSRLLGTAPGEPCPQLMHYFPGLYHLETIPAGRSWGDLCVTPLDSQRLIPLVRYRTGDEVRLLAPDEVGGLFKDAGLPATAHRFKGLPAAAVRGRAPRITLPGGTEIAANGVKEALFRDQGIAGRVSGNFRLTQSGPGEETRLLIQLAEGWVKDDHVLKRMEAMIAEFLPGVLRIDFSPYHEFPYGFGHDFERKNRYYTP